jgi:acyl-coenzyme A thioesterase PaaI-like protein
MSPFDMIKAQLGDSVPFARHAGVKITDIAAGAASAELEETATSVNHIGSQHAGALFTLGETASGAAMAGLFADRLLGIRPVTTQSTIAYKKIAKGTITARARVDGDGEALRAALDRDGRVRFSLGVALANTAGAEVATMTVEWDVKKV